METITGLLADTLSAFQEEALGLKDLHNLTNRRKLCRQLAGRWKEVEQGRKPVQSIAEPSTYQDGAVRAKYAPEFYGACPPIANVVNNLRHPGEIARGCC